MRPVRTVLAALLVGAAAVLALAAPARADSCGDTGSAWVGTAAVYTGTITSESATHDVILAVTSLSAAVLTVDTLPPLVGTWSYTSDFRVSASLEGFGWFLEMSAGSCSGSNVATAGGGANSSTYESGTVALTRTV